MAGPLYVPVLTGDDICKGKSQVGRRRCLGSWADTVFGPTTAYDRIIRALRAECEKIDHQLGAGIVCHNDVHLTKKQAADVWNRVMVKKGYTEIEEGAWNES